MLKSMTGFGAWEGRSGEQVCRVECRSVNNRYLEVVARLPKYLSHLEIPLKKLIKGRCARGSVDISVILENGNGNSAEQEVRPNMALAREYCAAVREIKDTLGLAGELDINSIIPLRDLIKVEPLKASAAPEDMIMEAVERALSSLLAMRAEEGSNLQADVLRRLNAIEELIAKVETRQPAIADEYKNKLRERIKAFTENVPVDEARLAQETAIMADRSDISEEIVRLRSHIGQFRQLTGLEEPLGRKLEFITQEINREANTISSKTTDYQVSQAIIEVKSILEKVREQLQNIE